MFDNFYFWMKYGGQICISDVGTNSYDDEIANYCKDKDYTLFESNEYVKFISNTGFININFRDNSSIFSKLNRAELSLFIDNDNLCIEMHGFAMLLCGCLENSRRWEAQQT